MIPLGEVDRLVTLCKLSNLIKMSCISAQRSGTRTQMFFLLGPEVGHNIALHASPTARICAFLIYALLVHSSVFHSKLFSAL